MHSGIAQIVEDLKQQDWDRDHPTRAMINPHDNKYHKLLEEVLSFGNPSDDRTGVGTLSCFGAQTKYDLGLGFPLLTTKKVSFNMIVEELLWFIKGETNIRPLVANKVNIWNDWPLKFWGQQTNTVIPKDVQCAEYKALMKEFVDKIISDEGFAQEFGELGPVYGKQWRSWACPDGRIIDQLKDVIESIRTNPNSRRHIVCAWNPADTDEMAISGLPPCHCLFQFNVSKGKLNCQLYQRSADVFLGVPFNIASYALLTHMIARDVGLDPGVFTHTFGDVHIYKNHIEQVNLQLSRDSRSTPRLELDPTIKSVFDFEGSHIRIEGYDPHEAIKAPIAV